MGPAFKGRHFAAEAILSAVQWYPIIPVSYRELKLIPHHRGVRVDYRTVLRWIQPYAREAEQRIGPHLRPSNSLRRINEA